MDWYHGDIGTSDPKTASGGNAASGRKWRCRLGRKNEWFCPQDAAVSDFSLNLTQRPHSLCFLDQHKEWGRLALGTGVICAALRPGTVLQRRQIGAVSVSCWCRTSVRMVSSSSKRASSVAMSHQGDMAVS